MNIVSVIGCFFHKNKRRCTMFLMNIIRDIADPHPIPPQGIGTVAFIIGGVVLLALVVVAAVLIIKRTKGK